jgi:hypothetical protein
VAAETPAGSRSSNKLDFGAALAAILRDSLNFDANKSGLIWALVWPVGQAFVLAIAGFHFLGGHLALS